MTVIKGGFGVIGLRCDSAGCPRRLMTETLQIPRTAYGVRIHATALGWSRDMVSHSVMGNPRLADYCPACVTEREAADKPCRHCTGGPLFDLLGHDHLGHRSTRSLLRAGYDTPGLAHMLTWQEINDLFQVGLIQARHIWTTLHPGVEPPELPRDHPNLTGRGGKRTLQYSLS